MRRASFRIRPVPVLALCALVGCGSGGSKPDTAPTFGTATIADKIYVRGEAIPAETLPAATGGDGPLIYLILPDLPDGIRFEPATRALSGTPTAGQPATSYEYVARESNEFDPESATLRFSIEVVVPLPEASIAGSATEMNEWEDRTGIAVTVTLDPAPEEATTVALASTGTATLGGDFDLGDPGDAPELTVAAGSASVTATVRPIRDLEEEGDETIVLAVQSVRGTDVDDGATVEIAIRDAGAPDLGDAGIGDVDGTGFAFLFGEMFESFGPDAVEFDVWIINAGNAASSATSAYVVAKSSPEAEAGVRASPADVPVPALEPGDTFETAFAVSLADLAAGANAYFDLRVDAVPEEPEVPEGEEAYGACGGPRTQRACSDLHIAGTGEVRTTCPAFSRTTRPGAEDPLFVHQWALSNTGQTAFARVAGMAGEDLRMAVALADGPTGSGVQVAVVDSGLEICHPDLAANVEPGASHNFAVAFRHGASTTDPFSPRLTLGDHGTSVAGIIAAVGDNGIGLRGVAPRARLRGFNLLESQDDASTDPDAVEIAALGMSSESPRSDDVDIFNMSYGGGEGGVDAGADLVAAFRTGTETLRPNRDGEGARGALYVRAAGNLFEECAFPTGEARVDSLHLENELGCVDANAEGAQNIPYLVVVGAFGADGRRAVYSSTGSNLWAVAPADGSRDLPAVVTTDQAGLDRGYVLSGFEPLAAGHPENPDGDYMASFGGTSAAAPMAAGAIALLLEARPELTWRDVKHLIAKTARRLEPDLPPVRVAFGGKPAVLRHPWITNAAGYGFHNWFGFGAIDVDRALDMARTIEPDGLGVFAESDPHRAETALAIPDHDGAGVSSRQAVEGLPAGADIEAVQLRVEIDHPDPGELGFELVSPSGTPSVLNPVFNRAFAGWPGGDLDWTVLSNAFYGEPPEGEWELNVIDVWEGNTGTLNAWSLVFYTGEHP